MAELPPLPAEVDAVRVMMRGEPDMVEALDYYYTADQMRAYAEEAVKQERGACAAVCESLRGGVPPHTNVHDAAVEDCAAAIRARSSRDDALRRMNELDQQIGDEP